MRNSPLFKPRNIENSYQGWSDNKLQEALEEYRAFQLAQAPFERKQVSQNLTILVEGYRHFQPDEKLLKQCALYVENVIINDPLFELTYSRDESHRAMNAFVGLKGDGIERDSIATSARYMKNLSRGIQTNFIGFAPLSYLHEPPKETPFYFSENLFADVLPHDLLSFWLICRKSE
jgi:hypothetical protein